METAIQNLPAFFSTTKRFLSTINDVFIFLTVAFSHMLLFARITQSWMTISFTIMLFTVQLFLTLFSTLKSFSFFTTLHHSFWFPTVTSNKWPFKFAWSAFSTMANIGAEMGAKRASFSFADSSTGMGFKVTLKFRVLVLSTKTIIFW